MIKVNLLTTAGKKSDMFAEHQTPREILDYFGVDYGSATNSIDGVRMTSAQMDTPLKELGVTTECRISSIVKVDNAASVTISGGAAILESDVTLADWQRVQKYAPEALAIIDDELDEVVFRVMVAKEAGLGSIDKNGVVFGDQTNKDGKATVTVVVDVDAKTPKEKAEAVREAIGAALLDLIEIEKGVPETLKSIAAKEAEINKLIVAE